MTLTIVLLMLGACKKEESSNPKVGTVTDVCGNTYSVVKIGEQYWMAENMSCKKYDTESEAYKAGFQQLSQSATAVDNPYYVNGTDRGLWNDEGMYAENITEKLLPKLGLLYNWAAAMGYKSESEAHSQKGAYSGKRQGICPNGWHIPSIKEWGILCDAIYDTYDEYAGTHMKSTEGWYSGSGYVASDNKTGFSALPAGGAMGYESMGSVGKTTSFWSSDARDNLTDLDYNVPYFGVASDYYSSYACSVRCIKD